MRVQRSIGPGFAVAAFLACAFVAGTATLGAHGVSAGDARYLRSIDGPAIVPLLYLGAKHMVTGYDHLLFLAGVVFLLSRPRHIILYVSLFTAGHSVTLLAGALAGLRANPYLIDAIIGLSIVYKGFENMGGFKRLIGVQPNPRVAVLVFGLFHGLGLATKLQDLALSRRGLVTNIVSFNIGVEAGQILALVAVLIALAWWRRHPSYLSHVVAANAVLMAGGFLLMGYQMAGYFVGPPS